MVCLLRFDGSSDKHRCRSYAVLYHKKSPIQSSAPRHKETIAMLMHNLVRNRRDVRPELDIVRILFVLDLLCDQKDFLSV